MPAGPAWPVLVLVLAIAAAYPAQAGAEESAASLKQRQPVALKEIVVETDASDLPSDGRSLVNVTVRLLDAQGQALPGIAHILASSSAGQILVKSIKPGLAQGRADVRLEDGATLRVEDGVGHFTLVAPDTPQDVTLSVSSGELHAQGQISFRPDLRPMIVSGIAEGVLSRRAGGTSNAAQRFNDGFEQSIARWSRQFGAGRSDAAARLAFFLKGQVGADSLLTAAYDSDKAADSRLLRDADPNRYYPIYGDSAISGFDAQSKDRLYLRLDQGKHYLMYGDFATGAGFSQASGGAGGMDPQLHKLGQYNRSATGLRGHYEQGAVSASAFAVNDSLRQQIEEYPANGTSGPYAVRSINAIQNSDKVELLVRDKNQLSLVKQSRVLQRYVDYGFEPLSGRILFNQAIATLTPEGDPQSIRITYEVDQGGARFWVAGADLRLELNRAFSMGAVAVEDSNPEAPYQLQSVAGLWRLGEATSLALELARSNALINSAGTAPAAAPAGAASVAMMQGTGRAQRAELSHNGEQLQARAYWQSADRQFSNLASAVAAGRSEAGGNASLALTESSKLFAEVISSSDQVSGGHRAGARAGIVQAIGERLKVELSLRRIKDDGALPVSAAIGANAAPPGSSPSTSGGFFSAGGTGLDPVTGMALDPAGNAGSAYNPAAASGARQYGPVEATTARLAAMLQLSEQLSVSADAEHSVNYGGQQRYGVAAQYTADGNRRLYARAETQTGLASSYSMNPADRSSSVIAGIDSSYMAGGTVFSEYHFSDALPGSLNGARTAQLASGLRNSWQLRDGVTANTGAEYLKVINGAQQDAVALSAAIDYRVDPLWSASAKLELRQLLDHAVAAAVATQGQQQWLNTLGLARKLSEDWTLLARNYLLMQRNRASAAGIPAGNIFQDRAQLGAAWRPRDDNRYNALARYEYKTVRDHSRQDGENYHTHLVSTHLDYHPSRPWWFNARLAGKLNTDLTLPAGQQQYTAWLLGGRAVYDLSERWDVGLMAAALYSPQGNSRQYAYGAELGYRAAKNLYLSVGHNLSGFTDKDLSGADTTSRGTFLRLRFKFDENTFGAN